MNSASLFQRELVRRFLPSVPALVILAALLNAAPESRAAALEDGFGTSTPIQGVLSVTGSSMGASPQPDEPAHAGVAAAHSLWAVWLAPNTGTYTMTTSNSTFDTVLAVYSGDELAALRPITSNDDVDFQDLTSRVHFRAYAGEKFHVAVDGVGGARGAVQLNVLFGGRPMMPWSAYTPQGLAVPSSTFSSNRVLLVDFWETVCGACVEELPDLISLYHDFAPRGFNVLGFGIDANPAAVQRFVMEHGTPYPILIPSVSARSVFILSEETFAVPTKFVVDQERQIVATYVGGHDPRSATYPYYEAEIAPLLREPPPLPLAIRWAEGNVLLSWPAAEIPFRLEATSALGGIWAPTQGVMRTNAGRVEVTVPAAIAEQFFRLRAQVN
jgi:thiol-disulfide isomerase/thioredoxin